MAEGWFGGVGKETVVRESSMTLGLYIKRREGDRRARPPIQQVDWGLQRGSSAAVQRCSGAREARKDA